MKNTVLIFMCCFIINLHAAEKEKDYTDEIYARLFGKEIIQEHGVTKPKNKFKDIFPIICKHVRARPEYQEKINEHAQNWLLKELVMVEDDYRTALSIHAGLKVTIDDFKISHDKDNKDNIVFGYRYSTSTTWWLLNSSLQRKQGGQTFVKEHLLKNKILLLSRLLRAKMYMEEKMHYYHAELVNRIYSWYSGAFFMKKTPLTDVEQKHFKLLPASFQKALMPYVCYALPESNNNR